MTVRTTGRRMPGVGISVTANVINVHVGARPQRGEKAEC